MGFSFFTFITSVSKKWFAGIFLLLLFQTTYSQQNQSIRLQNGWEFYKGDLGSTWEALRTGRPAALPQWENVTVPHCYNAFDAVDPDKEYYQGPAWYRTYIELENPYTEGKTMLHFEGAGQKTKVFVAEFLAGEHIGGYDEFRIDLTGTLKEFHSKYSAADFGGKIPLLIRVDNSRDTEMIPSDLSDFTIYGGIYRYLNLVYVPQVSISNVHITPKLSDDLSSSELTIEATIYNPDRIQGRLPIEFTIHAPGGKEIYTHAFQQIPGPGNKITHQFNIDNIALWSPDDPQLYSLNTSISWKGQEQSVNSRFGLRHFEFIQDGPFMLNGERLLLRGMHRHEDHAGVGAAMTEEMIRTEMQMIKDIGTNFIRLGHYQQSGIVLDLCDELGLFVWEEIPWCRGGLGGEAYKEQARSMLTNMITQHYNHPSVIIWGLGNENDWPGDFDEFDQEQIRAFMSELHALSHTLDPSRKTAIRRCAFCADIVDVYSPSIWAGWYRGKYTDYLEVSKMEMEQVDHFLHVEWGASSHAGRHSEDPDKSIQHVRSQDAADEREGDFLMSGGEPRVSMDGDWTESYAVNLVDWHLKEQEKMDWLTGTAYWPFKDFATPLRPENPIPYVNQKGVVQRDLTPKESYYVFKSYWTEAPMAHIYGHTWTTRWGEKDGENMVKVYSNCPSAELFLNGISQGTRERDSQDFPAAGLRWIVAFEEGENHLEVVATNDGTTVSDELKVNYMLREWEAPAQLLIEETRHKNDTADIRVLALDNHGNLCLDADNWISFGISGDGKLIDNLGTSDGARRMQMYNGRARIKVKMNQGSSVVSASSEGIPTVICNIGENVKATQAETLPAMPLLQPGLTQKEVLNQMKKVADWQLANMPVPGNHPRHYHHWDWANAALYTGISALYQTNGNKKYLKALEGFAESVDWSCGPRFRHADDVCIGQTYLELNEIKPANYKIEKIKNRMDSLMADPRPGRVDYWWCDALYMSPPTLARLAATTGNMEYLDYMNQMWWDASDFLYDDEESLFYRDDRFRIKEDGSGRREPNGGKVFWSRGNGWVIAGIARVLQYMPEDYSDRQQYIDMFTAMATKIVSLQGADGLWKSSLLYPEGHAHGETSGSGFFGYALAWGINNGILERDAYLPVVLRTWNGLTGAVNQDGKLGWVQRIGSAPDEISKDGTEVYGVGAYLLAGSEIFKLLE
ncbi:MAG: glycoside hydrolase family 88 protein [Bacteroidales bacterium]|nr:glycoside hydrolase family 88 protein [Bacteroidales bacterium]MDT8432358.1 glycoside hydrolase family 88 protein [Bacteroidales bacterium]